MTVDRAPGLDTLLDLHGETLFIDDIGHWVKFVVLRTDVTTEHPLVLSCSFTLHAPDGTKLVGFDNAHPVRERRDPGMRRRRPLAPDARGLVDQEFLRRPPDG